MTIDVDQLNKLRKEIAVANQAQDAISGWHTDLKKRVGGSKEELVRHIEKLCAEYMKMVRATLSHANKFQDASKRTALDTTEPLWYERRDSGVVLTVPEEMIKASSVPMDLLLGVEIKWEGNYGHRM